MNRVDPTPTIHDQVDTSKPFKDTYVSADGVIAMLVGSALSNMSCCCFDLQLSAPLNFHLDAIVC